MLTCSSRSPGVLPCCFKAVFVPSTFSGEPRDFYLGVVHAESNRAYQNYFYKMQVRHHRDVLFVSLLHLTPILFIHPTLTDSPMPRIRHTVMDMLVVLHGGVQAWQPLHMYDLLPTCRCDTRAHGCILVVSSQTSLLAMSSLPLLT